MSAGYDRIASVYELLASAVFGKSIRSAQVCLLRYIPSGSSVLIAGGGTGWILEEIALLHPKGVEIDYVESSEKMIALSRQRHYGQNQVDFIHQPLEGFISAKQYDIIITAFFLDNFGKENTAVVFDKLDKLLVRNGHWLYADFAYDKAKSPVWQGILLYIMYAFFRVTCGIEAKELHSVDGYFEKNYSLVFEDRRYFGFIRSAVYKRIGN